MTDLATPTIAELRAWHQQQNPLVRALTEPVIDVVTARLSLMQGVMDAQAEAITQLEHMVRTLQEQVQRLQHTAQQQHELIVEQQATIESLQAAAVATAAGHALALQVTKDRIDQLERQAYGPKSERRTKTTDPNKVARKRARAAMTEEAKAATREAAARAKQAKLDALNTKTVVIPLGSETPDGRPLPPAWSVIYE